ncbi:MAG: aldehyde dehydrogenase family protein [Trueperaceae bacterium]|nr:aldehyde dehydrogenase family protein [Trueperaceae bacterium]
MPTVREIFDTMDYGPAPESAADANAWLDDKGRAFGHFVAGRPEAPGDATFETRDPATGEALATVTQGSEADVARAVAAARAAFPAWAALRPHERARHLYAVARHVQKHARLLAVLETLDNGKPIRESRDIDVPLVARHFYHHAGWAQLRDESFPGLEPLGVAGQVIPWNFPLLMLSWKVAPALAAGNTVVLKPAEHTPLTALLFAEIAREAGLPDGVLNVVTGDGATGAALVAHPDVDKVAFTGSTEVGRRIREATAGSGKGLTLELGGKGPFVVFENADIDGAIEGVVDAIWFNQGQVCCAGSRLLLQEGIADEFLDRLRRRMETLRVGNPLDKAIDMGAIVAPVQLERIRELCAIGEAEGSVCWQPSWAVPEEGLFFPPTLFTNVDPASTLAQVEIFGPVLVSTTFRTPAEAVEMANDSRYGLAASVWSEDVNLCLHVAPKLEVGVVWINGTNQFDAAAGFGGVRESGFGREGGREGMTAYLTSSLERRRPAYDDGELAAPPTAGVGAAPDPAGASATARDDGPTIDRTAKLYIGGKQRRPDGNYVYAVVGADGTHLGEAGLGSRKDVRDAVEAARKATAWSGANAHARAQVLYYLAENLAVREDEFADRVRALTGTNGAKAHAEVRLAVERLFAYAAWADKMDGDVHQVPARAVTLAMKEPLGVVGVACPDEAPLLALVSMAAPLLALGNRVVAVPSPRWPLAATDLYQVLDTSDLPGGALNLVTGARDELASVLAGHDDVQAMWYVGSADGGAEVERLSAGNLKPTWTNQGRRIDWFDQADAYGGAWLRRSYRVKNVWVPYGV